MPAIPRNRAMPDSSLTTRTLALTSLAVLLNAVGNVLLKIGMQRVGEIRSFSPGALVVAFFQAFTTGVIWLGVGVLAMFFVCYMVLLSWADYSYVQPASAGGYAVVPLFGWLLAGEQVGALRWSGVLLICLGVALVGRTCVRTSEGG
jgi:drug/metabolite transporter (DMT)-like permease